VLAPGTLLQNRYLIMRLIAEGGMGAVYLAHDQRLDSPVALKETRFTDQRMSKAFEREARLLARLRHPALPRVSDHFIEENGQFLIMEYIPGEDLAETLKRRAAPFSYEDVTRWADQLLDALEYLHSQEPPIVHRDIKPQNLKLTERGQIILLDFGLAKGMPLHMTRVTSSGSIYGYTPSYAPMEQIQGAGTDPRSDLYSLGATLYHFLTGATPMDALTRAAAVLEGQPDPLRAASEVNSLGTSAVAAVIQKALALSRNHRHASATEMRRAIRTALESASETRDEQTAVIGSPKKVVTPLPHESEQPPASVSAEAQAEKSEDVETVPRVQTALRVNVHSLVSAGSSAVYVSNAGDVAEPPAIAPAIAYEPQEVSYRFLWAIAITFVLVVIMVYVLKPIPTTTSVAPQGSNKQPRKDAPSVSETVPAGQPLIVKLEAATGDTWVKYQVDDSKPTTLVLKQGQSQDLPPAEKQVTLNCGNRLTLKLKINNRDADFPPDTPKFKSVVVISRDNLQTFFR
jgi:serine/threonine protein kinase